MPLKQEK